MSTVSSSIGKVLKSLTLLWLHVGLVQTDTTIICNHGDIRLMGGSSQFCGRVEYCNGGVWGTVCDDGWGGKDASVVCRQLGYSDKGAIATHSASFGRGSGDIWLNYVNCDGSEGNLTDCTARTHGSYYCSHYEDAGVICKPPSNTTSALGCRDGDIRLVGGAADHEGQVELCSDCAWHPICDRRWDSADATVVCRQLGYNDTGTVAVSDGMRNRDGLGLASPFTISCDGSEEKLSECYHHLSYERCGNAGVICNAKCTSGCKDGGIRLAGGTRENGGRVEVCVNCVWTSVCHLDWSITEATIVCRQLGYGNDTGVLPILNVGSGRDSSNILLETITCEGSEERLLDCHTHNVGRHQQCTNAGVVCQAPCTSGCIEGDVRLAGGITERGGRVEVCINCEWVPVYDSSWDRRDAAVVCKQLGYNATEAIAIHRASYEQSVLQFHDVKCNGSEEKLIDCPANLHGNSSLVYLSPYHAGVVCHGSCSSGCKEGDVRIVGGITEREGHVEVCINCEWVTVCRDTWDREDAIVVCRQLGYNETGTVVVQQGGYSDGTGSLHLHSVSCSGKELRLIDCPITAYGNSSRSTCVPAGVICHGPCTSGCTEGDVKLVKGRTERDGRVEVCINCDWTSVCDIGWNNADATVVCRQLGYNDTGAVALGLVGVSPSTDYLNLRLMSCDGSERRLIDCPATGYRINSPLTITCYQAGVVCQGPCASNCTEGDVRLIGGNADHAGHVEMCVRCEWATVCDYNWRRQDAAVVCRQLGYSDAGVLAINEIRSSSRRASDISLHNIVCSGREERLTDCSYTAYGEYSQFSCFPSGVVCPGSCTSGCKEGDVQLVSKDRVQLCIGCEWVDVCDNGWDSLDATVICRQLGYNSSGAIAISRAGFVRRRGTGFLQVQSVSCRGHEQSISDCPVTASRYSFSRWSCYSAGVVCPTTCTPGCVEGDVRLVGGATDHEGRVEVCVNCEWGTVCHDYWDVSDATVVCRQLGYNKTEVVAVPSAGFGQGTGRIWLDNVECIGDEARLTDCSARDIGTHNCLHSGDAGVRCQPQDPLTTSPSVYFQIGNTVLQNNSMVSMLSIGEGDNALLCKTNKVDCCGEPPNRHGEFYYPSGDRVLTLNQGEEFYRNRGERMIRLNKKEGVVSPTGTFRCTIPDKDDVIQSIFIDII